MTGGEQDMIFRDFIAAGKKQGLLMTVGTLLATMIGASSTIGIVDTTYSIGFPGFWWLAFGGIGLLLQSFLISEKVREIDADTLPDMAGRIVGGSAEMILSLIIVISWIGVIAGQLVAMSGFLTFVTGNSGTALFIIASFAVLLYVMIGGQMSVVKTDFIQMILVLIGIIAAFIYLFFVKKDASGNVMNNIELLNQSYTPKNLFTQFFTIGGVYFLGPDIISRNFISKDKKVAKRAALICGIVLIIFGFVVALIGLWAKENVPPDELGDMNVLFFILKMLPLPVEILLAVGLLSAILSSFDTCIVNAASIFVKDILKKESVALTRIVVVVIGVLAMAFAISGNGDIISLLSGAYSVYTSGIIFPLFIAIMCYGKREIRVNVWIPAVICGGIFGIMGSYFPGLPSALHLPVFISENMTLTGMAVSSILGLVSIGRARAD
jgi:SSS family solute:Na+ symporter